MTAGQALIVCCVLLPWPASFLLAVLRREVPQSRGVEANPQGARLVIIQTSGAAVERDGEARKAAAPEPLIPTQRASTPAGSDFFRTLDGSQPCAHVERKDDFTPRRHDNAEAQKRVCRGCSFLQICGEYAFAHPSEKGVWGGMTWNDRQDIRREMRRAS